MWIECRHGCNDGIRWWINTGMAKFNTRVYSDFDLNFIAHPLPGDLVRKFDEEAIKRSIAQLIKLNSYEKPFQPDIASGVNELLFEQMGLHTALRIESRVKFLIKQFEPRADLISVSADPQYEANTYEVTITFRIINQLNPITQRIFLQRVR